MAVPYLKLYWSGIKLTPDQFAAIAAYQPVVDDDDDFRLPPGVSSMEQKHPIAWSGYSQNNTDVQGYEPLCVRGTMSLSLAPYTTVTWRDSEDNQITHIEEDLERQVTVEAMTQGIQNILESQRLDGEYHIVQGNADNEKWIVPRSVADTPPLNINGESLVTYFTLDGGDRSFATEVSETGVRVFIRELYNPQSLVPLPVPQADEIDSHSIIRVGQWDLPGVTYSDEEKKQYNRSFTRQIWSAQAAEVKKVWVSEVYPETDGHPVLVEMTNRKCVMISDDIREISLSDDEQIVQFGHKNVMCPVLFTSRRVYFFFFECDQQEGSVCSCTRHPDDPIDKEWNSLLFQEWIELSNCQRRLLQPRVYH
jgi:hypothetical protein